MRMALGVVVGIVALTVAPSFAAVLCSTRTGILRVRDACRPGETQVDPVKLGLLGPPGPPGPKGDTGDAGPRGPALTWNDANGEFVGLADMIGSPNIVRRLPNGDLVPLLVNEAGFTSDCGGPGNLSFWFTSSDCSGTPLLFRYGQRAVSYPTYVCGTTVYYAPAVSTTTIASILTHEDAHNCGLEPGVFTPPDTCCITRAGVASDPGSGYGPVVNFDLSTLGLVPPFHVEGP